MTGRTFWAFAKREKNLPLRRNHCSLFFTLLVRFILVFILFLIVCIYFIMYVTETVIFPLCLLQCLSVFIFLLHVSTALCSASLSRTSSRQSFIGKFYCHRISFRSYVHVFKYFQFHFLSALVSRRFPLPFFRELPFDSTCISPHFRTFVR